MNFVTATRLVNAYQSLTLRGKVSVMVVSCALTLILVVSVIGAVMSARHIMTSESQGE